MLGPSLHSLKRQAETRGYDAQYIDRVLDIAQTLQTSNVPTVFSLMHLAALSNTPWSGLRAMVRRQSDDYRVFQIRKRSGGNRRICAPDPPLRRVQSWIHRNILCSPGALARLHDASTAYAPGSSIKANAARHVGSAWMVKVDIKDFFESISERQVYRVFRDLGYPALLSFEMARLCTRIVPGARKREAMWRWTDRRSRKGAPYSAVGLVGHLPQGAPTSAMLANLVAARLDAKIQSIADAYGASYTRYADDFVLTGDMGSRSECNALLSEVVKEISLAGYRVNRVKTHVGGPGTRKVVTGLVINDHVPRLPRATKDDILLSLYHIKKRGLLKHLEHRHSRSPLGYLNHLVGRILFAHSIEEEFGRHAMAELRVALAPYRDLIAMVQAFGPAGGHAKPFENLHRLIFADA